ncbi:MAG: polysaccharide biosynthesis C-terminal domain-containing protein [Acidobacteria bacterium]|nr:polysaccharide biosynthesis C-terminal domain-containing protein [Acidobacteriota bacterium]
MNENRQVTELSGTWIGRHRNAINVFSNWIGFGFAAVVNFFLSPVVVNHLGNTGYGVWVLTGTLTGYLGLLDLGVRGAASRYVAKLHTQSDHQGSSQVVSSALSIFAVGGVLAIVVAAILAFGVLGIFHMPAEFQSQARVVLLLTGVTVATSLVGGVFGGVLTGLQRFDISNAIEMLGVALRAVTFVLALKAGQGIVALAWLNVALSVLTGLSNLAASLHFYPQLELRMSHCTRDALRMIFSFSAYFFLLVAANRIVLFADVIVIGLFLPVSMITFFAIASNLINYGRTLLSGIWTATTPLASSLEARGAHEELTRMLLSRARFASLLMLPIGITFLLRGKSFIGLWMGASYAEPSGLVLQILTVYLLVSSGNLISNATMLGISKHKAVAPVALSEAACKLSLSVALIRPYGIYGVAWGTTIPSVIVSFFFWPWYVRRTLGIPIRSYALAVWGQPFAAAVPYALVTYLVEKYWAVSHLLLFFVQVAVVLPLALAGFWYVCFTRAERQEYAAHYLQPLIKALRLA